METLQDTSSQMTCPTCDARQVWSSECRRCKTDLSLLRQIWKSAEKERQGCLRALVAGEPEQARDHARRYAAYVGNKQASRLMAVSHLSCEDWPAAIRIADP